MSDSDSDESVNVTDSSQLSRKVKSASLTPVEKELLLLLVKEQIGYY